MTSKQTFDKNLDKLVDTSLASHKADPELSLQTWSYVQDEVLRHDRSSAIKGPVNHEVKYADGSSATYSTDSYGTIVGMVVANHKGHDFQNQEDAKGFLRELDRTNKRVSETTRKAFQDGAVELETFSYKPGAPEGNNNGYMMTLFVDPTTSIEVRNVGQEGANIKVSARRGDTTESVDFRANGLDISDFGSRKVYPFSTYELTEVSRKQKGQEQDPKERAVFFYERDSGPYESVEPINCDHCAKPRKQK
jgi:hypothetical protein